MFWRLKDILEPTEVNDIDISSSMSQIAELSHLSQISSTVRTQISNVFQYKPIQYMAAVFLYSFSILFSFLCAGIFVTPLTFKEIQEDIEEDKLAAKRAEEQNFENKYLDEYELLEEKDVDLTLLKETTLEIPFLKTTIIMFYEDGFKYYSNTDPIYKYLNVACRKFVVENDAKKLYQSGETETKTEQVTSDSDLFITKQETTLLEKKCNNFVRVGSIYDYNDKNNIKIVKEIDILDFLKGCKPAEPEQQTLTDPQS
jgi:hypothetical protein